MAPKPLELFSQFAGGTVSREKGLISGVSVISMGEARGHEMMVDALTLQQVKSCAELFKKGLKVKMDHYSGVDAIVGFLRNFKIEGEKLTADLQLLRTHPQREYVLELAEEISDNFGLSISFSGKHETIGEKRFARCTEIYSADLVNEPAANASGLFEQPKEPQTVDIKPKDMTPEEFKTLLEASLKPISDRIQSLEDKNKPAPVVEKTAEQKTEEFEASVRLAVAKEVSKLSVPAVVAAPEVKNEEVKKKSFFELRDEKAVNGVSKSQAHDELLKTAEGLAAYKEYRENTLGIKVINK
jgi:hypothetical protein